MALSTQTNYVSVIIQLQKQQCDYQALKNWLSTNANLWAYIVHDKDKHEDNTSKGVHLHAKFILNNNKGPRLSTTLNEMSKALSIDKTAFTIEKMESVSGSIQYLIHKNEPEKYQYDVSDIITNLSESELNTYLYAETEEINTDTLIDICTMNWRSKIAILKTIGLRYYSRYRGVIADICNEVEMQQYERKNCSRSTIASNSHEEQSDRERS